MLRRYAPRRRPVRPPGAWRPGRPAARRPPSRRGPAPSRPAAASARHASDSHDDIAGFGTAAAVRSSTASGTGRQNALGTTVVSAIVPKGGLGPPQYTRVPSSTPPRRRVRPRRAAGGSCRSGSRRPSSCRCSSARPPSPVPAPRPCRAWAQRSPRSGATSPRAYSTAAFIPLLPSGGVMASTIARRVMAWHPSQPPSHLPATRNPCHHGHPRRSLLVPRVRARRPFCLAGCVQAKALASVLSARPASGPRPAAANGLGRAAPTRRTPPDR